MKKQLLAAALLASSLSAGPAMALKSHKLYTIRFEDELVGTWRLRNRVVDLGDRCEYTVKWQNLHEPRPLKRSVICRIEERKASDSFDCEAMRKDYFPTVIFKKTGGPCDGFDEFGQQTRVSRLIAGENEDGFIVGIIDNISVGDIQNLLVIEEP